MILIIKNKFLSFTACALVLGVLQGCAVAPNTNPRDPWEPFNRGVTRFNEGLDKAIVRPVAVAYQNVTPAPVRTGVSNFFGNISDVWSLVNNVLQGKPKESVETLMRVSMNTFFGFAGVIDIATPMRLEKHKEDFGQTLGYWGVGTGPYLVLPVLGPSTLRDGAALIVDARGDLVTNLSDVPLRNSLFVLRGVDARANLLRATNLLDEAALDKYSFTRDSYLQRRRGLIKEGKEEKSPTEERFDLPEGAKAGSPAPAGKEDLQDGAKTSSQIKN